MFQDAGTGISQEGNLKDLPQLNVIETDATEVYDPGDRYFVCLLERSAPVLRSSWARDEGAYSDFDDLDKPEWIASHSPMFSCLTEVYADIFAFNILLDVVQGAPHLASLDACIFGANEKDERALFESIPSNLQRLNLCNLRHTSATNKLTISTCIKRLTKLTAIPGIVYQPSEPEEDGPDQLEGIRRDLLALLKERGLSLAPLWPAPFLAWEGRVPS